MRTLWILALLLTAIQIGITQSREKFSPKFKESKNSLFKIAEDQEYTFGYLEVPENRSDPNSKTIELPVYIFKSRDPNAPKDPVIYTVGGPGSTTMPSAQYMKYYRYLDDRDFILFEQRGTAYARPHLDCPGWAEAVYTINLPGFDSSKADSLLAKAAKDCRELLIGRGIDLNGYHTREIAADIEDLRIALGIEKYNLLTISYSTKIAQVLMRDYSGGIRSVVMDSPLPLEVNYDEESVQNLLETVDKLLADCEDDPGCAQAFPDLKKRFYDYLQEKTVNPLEVRVENPQNGKEAVFRLTGKDLISVFTTASTGEVPQIPFEIEKLLNNDLSSVKAQLLNLLEGPGNGAGRGMRLSVWCAEEFPFSSQEIIREQSRKYPQTEGLSPAVFDSTVCGIWGVKSQGELENQPVRSAIPTLLISGEYDNETPVKWASQMQQHLENSFHLVFKGWKHTPTTNWGDPCAMNVANAFFYDPTVRPDLPCWQAIQRPEFKTE